MAPELIPRGRPAPYPCRVGATTKPLGGPSSSRWCHTGRTRAGCGAELPCVLSMGRAGTKGADSCGRAARIGCQRRRASRHIPTHGAAPVTVMVGALERLAALRTREIGLCAAPGAPLSCSCTCIDSGAPLFVKSCLDGAIGRLMCLATYPILALLADPFGHFPSLVKSQRV